MSIARFFLRGLLCPSLLLITNLWINCATAAPEILYKIVTERTHAPTLFTQGLLVDGDYFYESSGLYGKSMLVSYPVAEPQSRWAKISAPFTKRQNFPERFFAEGLALLNGKLFVLTWMEETLFIYDKATMNYEKTLSYKGEGWGLTTDGKSLIRSDGSATLYFHDPKTFNVDKKLTVKNGDREISKINELEYANGFLWANVWYEDTILKIDVMTGAVVGELNLSALKEKVILQNFEQVLNGIAWDESRNGFWVTGKQWPKMFLITIL